MFIRSFQKEGRQCRRVRDSRDRELSRPLVKVRPAAAVEEHLCQVPTQEPKRVVALQHQRLQSTVVEAYLSQSKSHTERKKHAREGFKIKFHTHAHRKHHTEFFKEGWVRTRHE